MDLEAGIEVAQYTIYTTLLVALPVLLVALGVGLVVSILQAVTQVNELTLTFVPKMLVMALVLMLLMPWLTSKMMEFTVDILHRMGGG